VCNDRVAEGIPRVYYHGVHQQHAALVMELLGPSLEDLFARCQRHFTVKTIAMIAIQLVSGARRSRSHRFIDASPLSQCHRCRLMFFYARHT